MKKIVFACALMLCGMIGGTGWLIAYVCHVPNDLVGSLLQILTIYPDGTIILYFYGLALLGLVLAAFEIIKRNREESAKNT